MPLDNRTCFLANLRDGLSCRVCGKQPQQAEHYHRGFEYHHILPKSQGGANSPDNIALLCHECHQARHKSQHLPLLEPLPPPSVFSCRNCKAILDSYTVECNCGWYCCPHCAEIIHLYQHIWG